MNDKIQAWIEVSRTLIFYAFALGYNGILGYMYIAGRVGELDPMFWTIYAGFMSAIGLPMAYKGFKAIKSNRKD